MDTISYEDFAKLQIVIGTITAVESVPETDKLLKLTVTIGTDSPRQIISGIKQFFEDPQVLVGKQCPFLINLAPRIIKGLESQGMILAASHNEQFSLLHPQVNLVDGALVK